eukprot:TRINITY_DN5463_c0_g8_i1.p2 TRINITY_DN5463_c0_g8~~TRINITY_DN5463_c0_g8_i1.p2  ORF type:complete len:173 (+),score=39.67 TRINITY_DN5463_c0_g8_i1:295-813(+)
MKRALFGYARMCFNGISQGEVNAKNIGKCFAMFRLNHAMKKRKLRAQDVAKQIEGRGMRDDLAKFLVLFAKLQREADALEFLDARCKGETMSDKVLATATGNVEVTFSFDAYIKAGVMIISAYISKIRGIAASIVNKYGKARAGYITKEELVRFLKEKVMCDNLWRIEAFIE